MNENARKMLKIFKKIGKNKIFNKKIVERSSEGPGNYPKYVL